MASLCVARAPSGKQMPMLVNEGLCCFHGPNMALRGCVGAQWGHLGIMGSKKKAGLVKCQAQQQQQQQQGGGSGPKLVTFLGKGGVGKTFCAVMAAQYYASIGLRTCLVVQSQDVTADFLLGQKLGHSPTSFNNGVLTALRLESIKLLTEPLDQIKKADARTNFSQGALQEVAGEELSVLPGMDSIIGLGLMEQLAGFARSVSKRPAKSAKEKYDIIVYDGPNSEEILRMFGSAERARWYMNRFRSIAEKTDIGRVSLPSILRLFEAAFIEDSQTERSTSELWDEADTILQRVVDTFVDPKKFSSYIVTNPGNRLANETGLRYWGCAMQAGVYVAGVLHHVPGTDAWKDNYSPLTVAALPSISLSTTPNWEKLLSELDENACRVLRGNDDSSAVPRPVSFDASTRTVKCFLPGFDKSEVKLSQLRRSELLVEAGDQRRVICLPLQMCGKVAGAKFQDRSLVITLKAG